MQEAARQIESPTLALGYAVVETVVDGDLYLQTPNGRVRARKAVSCLLVPARGDQVLLSRDNFGRSYVLAVLERPDEGVENRLALTGTTRMTVAHGELTLTAERGVTVASPEHITLATAELKVHAARADIGLEETTVAGRSLSAGFERIRTVAGSMDSFVRQCVQRMSSCFRYVRDHDETQTASARQLVAGTLTVQTGNSVHMAEGHVKIDAEQIHLG
ncbi:MAG: DUF3540 domain-containing protein [Desulfatitalea sp.]|nr:DUF3540 domain-containing protein [Desulfatitalea sp.]